MFHTVCTFIHSLLYKTFSLDIGLKSFVSVCIHRNMFFLISYVYLELFRTYFCVIFSVLTLVFVRMCHQKAPASSSQNLKKLLSHCEDVYTHYKLAYEHKFLDVANMLLQDSRSNSYLSDRLGTWPPLTQTGWAPDAPPALDTLYSVWTQPMQCL